jgi:PAS domain S-box-containing protein
MFTWLVNPFSLVLLFAALISLFLAVLGWTRRQSPGGSSFFLLMVCVSWWALTSAVEVSPSSLSLRLWAGKLQYLSIASIAPLWLLFALAHGRRLAGVSPLRRALMWLPPVVIAVLAFTNERHNLVWTAIRPASDAPNALLVYSHGPAVWIFFAFSYLLLLLGTVLLIKDALRSQKLYRQQSAWLIAGAVIPWLGNAAYMLKLGPAGLDLTPLGFTAAGVLTATSLFLYRLLDIVPVAHSALIESMSDCIIVLDSGHRILELNPAARRLLGLSASAAGTSLLEHLRPWPDFAVLAEGMLTEPGDRVVRCPEMKRWLDVRISPLSGKNGLISGRLIVLRDITAQKAAQEDQAASLERAERQKRAIVGMAFHPAVTAGDWPAAASAIAEAGAGALDVARVSLWQGSFLEGRIVCQDLFELPFGRHSGGDVLEAGRYPAYFRAIESDRAVDASDALTDPRTAEFRDGYLVPKNITSLLDAPIRALGRMQGIICFEQVGPPRTWRSDEIHFAAALADQAALALLNRERHRVQEDLAKREERLRFIMDNMIDLISQLGPDNRAVFVSPSVERVLGYKFADLLGRLPSDFVHPDDLPALNKDVARAVAAREPSLRLEYRFRHAAGHFVWVESLVMLAYDAEGRTAGGVYSSRDVSARRRAEEALRASLREKDVLLQEVHHRVRNNMQIISSLLNHQARLITDPAVLSMFRESQNRIRSIALVHEKLYRSADLSRIDFAEYIETLIVHLFHTLQTDSGRVGYRSELAPLEVDVTTAIPLGLIVNELVMNALKHAFPQARRGTVAVRLERAEPGRLRLEVADDGVGLPPGFDAARSESLGWQIVHMLADQVGGTVAVHSGPGTSVTVEFPEGRPAVSDRA